MGLRSGCRGGRLRVAGVAAAIEAARAGADVLVLERLGAGGGAAALSGGFIYLGGGTPLQALGFSDSVENMKAFMKAALGPGVDEAKIDVYCDGSVDHFNWLVDAGVVFDESFGGEPGWEPPHGEGLMFSGGENSAPFNALIPLPHEDIYPGRQRRPRASKPADTC
ncbi:FAD-binding protein [Rhodococcus jostii]|uniref:FAD-binding protein n=1 Tax=Rhodococcus jostii TaxID=132919 RepID=UPI003C6E2046